MFPPTRGRRRVSAGDLGESALPTDGVGGSGSGGGRGLSCSVMASTCCWGWCQRSGGGTPGSAGHCYPPAAGVRSFIPPNRQGTVKNTPFASSATRHPPLAVGKVMIKAGNGVPLAVHGPNSLRRCFRLPFGVPRQAADDSCGYFQELSRSVRTPNYLAGKQLASAASSRRRGNSAKRTSPRPLDTESV